MTSTPPPPSAAAPELARLEAALSALVRWSESRHVRAEVARQAGCDMPASALRLLEHFAAAGPQRVSDIAECLRVDVSTVSLQLRRLRADALVVRRTDPADGRSAVIAITEEGRRALERIRSARRGLLAEAFGATPPEQLGRAADVLGLLQEHMLRDPAREAR
ncbi:MULTISPECIES: MarR family transcriptional regulator [Kitasatospora]|uniref:Putative MarR family transcriptional regulator n=1 Tax=Kitasatospora setae (strain ATCC 33774 / DSM 43861 / JCM 3304 / KCC A-0304 / NBRC 14216 / KM-6054) TaxID=452652 RepID=E4N6Y7_KITSK|nr:MULTISPECIES: MarR family transcriptional regulator [Kitasatospora]BAJ26968.1 putative MarR family transcriptional regulator [Kitasatospora setae KM-6054]